MTELLLRTTVTSDSVQLLFGPPGAIDYRAHPGEGQDEDPLTIFRGMKEKEVKPLTDVSFLRGSIYSFKNRRIITRWLRDVCAAFHLKSTTLCLAVQLTDAFLVSKLKELKVDRCQLAAATALWVAAKFEEMDEDLPGLRKIVDVCDRAYSGPDVLNMEEAILSHFKWRLPHTTVVNHVYLQIHMLSTDKLVQKAPSRFAAGNGGKVGLLTVDDRNRCTLTSVTVPAAGTVREGLPALCAAARMPLTSRLEAFQVFGKGFYLAQRVPLDTPVKDLQGDSLGEVRFYLSTAQEQNTSVFVERGSYVILRTVNRGFLDLCDVLTQEVVTHVEFLRLACHVTALGVVALAFCLSPAFDQQESTAAVQYIVKTLGFSATQSLAAADLLCTKYKEALAEQPALSGLPEPSSDIRQRLSACFDRQLPQA